MASELHRWRMADCGVKRLLADADAAGAVLRAGRAHALLRALRAGTADAGVLVTPENAAPGSLAEETECNIEILERVAAEAEARVDAYCARLQELDALIESDAALPAGAAAGGAQNAERVSVDNAENEPSGNAASGPMRAANGKSAADMQPCADERQVAASSNGDQSVPQSPHWQIPAVRRTDPSDYAPAAPAADALGEDARRTHDELAGQLVVLAQQLRARHVALHDAVRADRAVVDEAEQALGQNAERFRGQHAALRGMERRTWRGSLRTLCLVILLMLSIAFVFVLIAVTSRH